MGPARPPAILIAIAAAAVLAGCGHSAKSRRADARRTTSKKSISQAGHAPAQPGVFHTVGAGETTFRIAQAYRVPVATLVRENALADAAAISVGQRLFIPGAAEVLDVGPVGAAAAAVRPPDGSTPAVAEAGPPEAAADEPSPRAAPAAARPRSVTKSTPALSNSTTPAAPSAARRPAGPAPAAKKPAAPAALAWPVHGVIFSPFGSRARDQHDGIDLAAPEGSPVVAADAGTVLFVGKKRGYGNLILVSHARDMVTVYAHNRENLVTVGQKIGRGALIARVGKTGNATGPHLHFEVRVSARPHDPMAFLR